MQVYVVEFPNEEMSVFLNKEKAEDYIIVLMENEIANSYHSAKYKILELIDKNDYSNAIVLYNAVFDEQIKMTICNVIR